MNLHARSLRRIVLALAAVAACAASSAACPQSCVHILWGPAEICTSAAQMDTTGHPNFNSVAQCGYNIPLGTLYALGHSGMDGCEPRTTVEDDFNVIGPPVGTVIPMTARLSLSLRASDLEGPGEAHAEVADGDSHSSSLDWHLFYFYGNTRDTMLTLPVTATVGTPFRMRFNVGALVGSLCSAEWHAAFDFTGFPAGVSIVSCNGYALGPTPTRTTTWGQLKARYR